MQRTGAAPFYGNDPDRAILLIWKSSVNRPAGMADLHRCAASMMPLAAGPLHALIVLSLAAAPLASCSIDVGDSGGSATIGERAANDTVAVTVHSVNTSHAAAAFEGARRNVNLPELGSASVHVVCLL
jgi:hypothetical protein